MKRIELFFYYLWALLTPVHDTNIWSVSLAWRLADIAFRAQREEREILAKLEAAQPKGGAITNEPKVPCPSCTWRGPVWLDANRKCVYCECVWANPDASIWSMVPLEWWLEEGMIDEAEIPEAQRSRGAAAGS